MKVEVTVVGEQQDRRVRWPKDMPVPREGETVWLTGIPPLYVRNVSYYPEGNDHGVDSAPYVYVVLGPSPKSRL